MVIPVISTKLLKIRSKAVTRLHEADIMWDHQIREKKILEICT